jgi:hypothetical protein
VVSEKRADCSNLRGAWSVRGSLLLPFCNLVDEFVFDEGFAEGDLAVVETEEDFVVWLEFEKLHDFLGDRDPVPAVQGSWLAEEFAHNSS